MMRIIDAFIKSDADRHLGKEPSPMSLSSPFHGPDLRGEVLDRRYRLDEFIASGGSGTVYAAVDLRLRRQVAVKVIHPEYARTEDQRRRIRQEALLGAVLDHPNLAPILDFGAEVEGHAEPLLYIVMPLLAGRTLRELVLDGQVPWTRAAGLVHQLLAGLTAMHMAGVLHRDVKLDNCLLVREGEREVLKLLDLGLAKVTADDLLSRPPLSVTGTLPYISPEQALGEPVDERTDVYAAGVVLFELLTRRPPFVGSDYQVLTGHVEQAVPVPSDVAPLAGIPATLDAVTLNALAKRREQRFASAADFDAALVHALGSSGLEADRLRRCAGCGAAREALAAWTCFDYPRARAEAESAARHSRSWSPLKLLMSLIPED